MDDERRYSFIEFIYVLMEDAYWAIKGKMEHLDLCLYLLVCVLAMEGALGAVLLVLLAILKVDLLILFVAGTLLCFCCLVLKASEIFGR